MSAIGDLTCADLTAAYRRGELSPAEVARDCLARIDASAAINAFLPIEPNQVLAAASESETRWRAGSPLGPIDGVPASIKDNICAKSLPTRRGSKTSDAAPAARIRRRSLGCASRAPSFSARPACPNMAGSASAIVR